MGITGASQNSYTLDAAHILKAIGGAAVTTSAAFATIIDFGAAYYRGDMVVDVSAIDTVTGDEEYSIVLQGTNVAGFGTKTDVWDIATLQLGADTPKATDSNVDDGVGRYVLGVSNEFPGGTLLRYVRLYTVAAIASSSITYSAFLSRNQG